jgi:hypothetical protein
MSLGQVIVTVFISKERGDVYPEKGNKAKSNSKKVITTQYKQKNTFINT